MSKKLPSSSIEFLNKFVSGSWIVKDENCIVINGDFDCSNGLKSDQKFLPKLGIKLVT